MNQERIGGILLCRLESMNYAGLYFLQKQKVAKTFARIRTSCGFYFVGICATRFLDSLKVSESLSIHNSPKWILRYIAFRSV